MFSQKVDRKNPNIMLYKQQYVLNVAKKILNLIISPQILNLKPDDDSYYQVTEEMDEETKHYKNELKELYIIGICRFASVLFI